MASDSAYMRFGLRVMGEMSAIILVPAIAAVLGARMLEARNNPKWAVYGIVAIAFALTCVLLLRRIRSYGREFERLSHGPKDRV